MEPPSEVPDPNACRHPDCHACKAAEERLRLAQETLERRTRELAEVTLRLLETEYALERLKGPAKKQKKEKPPEELPTGFFGWLRHIRRQRRKSRAKPKPRKKSRTERQCEMIEASGLFDAQWYRAQYRDVDDFGYDPLRHYLRRGAIEGRDPGPNFSTLEYLQRHPDVDPEEINPLIHFLENRDS